VAGSDFGTGSSREHAVWALLDAGFRVIIAPSFADIFASNCVNNGILTVRLDEETVAELAAQQELAVDLERCEIRSARTIAFSIGAFERHRLLHGLDEIGLTLRHEAEIARYERERRVLKF